MKSCLFEIVQNYNDTCRIHDGRFCVFYCICGKSLCFECIESQKHQHENFIIFKIDEIKRRVEDELTLILPIINELENKSNLSSLDLQNFKEIQKCVSEVMNRVGVNKLISFLNSNIYYKLNRILINTLTIANTHENRKLEQLVNKEIKNDNLRQIRNKEIKKFKRVKDLIEVSSHETSYNSINKYFESPCKKSNISSVYGSAYACKFPNNGELVSDFINQLFNSNPPSAAKIDNFNEDTPIHCEITNFDNLLDKQSTRTLISCSNCNVQFLSKGNLAIEFCSRCKKVDGGDKVTLICQCCRENFKTVVEEAENRTKCNICLYNSLKK